MEDDFNYTEDHVAGDDSLDPMSEEEWEIESRKFIDYCRKVAKEIRKQKQKGGAKKIG